MQILHAFDVITEAHVIRHFTSTNNTIPYFTQSKQIHTQYKENIQLRHYQTALEHIINKHNSLIITFLKYSYYISRIRGIELNEAYQNGSRFFYFNHSFLFIIFLNLTAPPPLGYLRLSF